MPIQDKSFLIKDILAPFLKFYGLEEQKPKIVSFEGQPIRIGVILDDLSSKSSMNQKIYEFGAYKMDSADFMLYGNEKSIKLTEKEAALLIVLMESPDYTADRKSLLREVWHYSDKVETHTLETHIYRLRQKIEENPAEPKIILTEGDGYRLKV